MSLIEVLVALVIFAIGLLGAAGLQLSSMRSGQFSAAASTAMSLARDYGEMMQIVPASAISTSAGGTNVFVIDSANTLSTPPDCRGTSATCTAEQMAAFNVNEWVQRVRASLPGGRAVVCKDTEPRGSDGLYRWACDDTGTMMVVKFDWVSKDAKSPDAGKGELVYKNAGPKLVISLFGNQAEFVGP